MSLLPNKAATASQACKHVYLHYPSAREISACHGKLRGLVKSCLYLQMDGATHGSLYLLSLNQEVLIKLFLDCDQRVTLPCSFLQFELVVVVKKKLAIVGVFLNVF